MRPESIKLLEENIGEKLFHIDLSNDFSHLTPKAQVKKAVTNEKDHIKLKVFYKANNKQNKKAIHRMGENKCKPNTQ